MMHESGDLPECAYVFRPSGMERWKRYVSGSFALLCAAAAVMFTLCLFVAPMLIQ